MPKLISLPFLKEKIGQLRSALLFSVSNAVLIIPNSVVQVLAVDEVGQIWFMIPTPSQQVQAFEQEFLAQMDFLKKGMNFCLKVVGKAAIVHDPEQVNCACCVQPENRQAALAGEGVLIKVKILQADYYDLTPKPAAKHWMPFDAVQHAGILGFLHRGRAGKSALAPLPGLVPPGRPAFQFIAGAS
jgi:hypothetical protein